MLKLTEVHEQMMMSLYYWMHFHVAALVTAVFPGLTFGQIAEFVNHGYPCKSFGHHLHTQSPL